MSRALRGGAAWLLLALTLAACSGEPIVPSRDAGPGDGGGPDAGAGGPVDRAACAGPFAILSTGVPFVAFDVTERRHVVAAQLRVGTEILAIYVDVDGVATNTFHEVGPLDGDGPVTALLGTSCAALSIESCARHWTPASGAAFVRVVRLEEDPARFWMTLGELVFTPATLARDPLAVTPTEPEAGEPSCQLYSYVEARWEPRQFDCAGAEDLVLCDVAE